MKSLFLFFISLLCIWGPSASSQVKISKNAPLFTKYSYKGNDKVYLKYPLKSDEFYNPILQGCYPDPSICKKGDDYFMVCSSFVMYPGVPIFHSKDLVNWKQIGHVLDRKSQLRVFEAGISEGIYAPVIRYNKYNDVFYMITTQFAEGIGNMVVKTKDPFLGWSDPIKLQFDGIDPSLFFDDDGKTYVVHNDAPDPGKTLYEGHRVIKIWEYDIENDKVVEGTDKIIVDGGVDITQEPIWIEAPHIYKRNGHYYLMCAEGGTGDGHSEVIFYSDNPTGPYFPAPNNPILTQRYFAKDRENAVNWAGHADLIEGPNNKFYGVFLAVRPNEKNRVNTGRETFILPIDWSGDFPVFENGLIPILPKSKTPTNTKYNAGRDGFFPNGNFEFSDNFVSEKLDYRWIGVRGPREDFVSMHKKGGVKILPYAVNIKDKKPTSVLFHRQQHLAFESTVTLTYSPKSEKDFAGVTCYQSESFNYVFGITKKNNKKYIVLERNERSKQDVNKISSTIIAAKQIDYKKSIQLKIVANGDDYYFNFATGDSNFENLGGVVSGDILSTDIAGGFTGTLIGLYATSSNDMKL